MENEDRTNEGVSSTAIDECIGAKGRPVRKVEVDGEEKVIRRFG